MRLTGGTLRRVSLAQGRLRKAEEGLNLGEDAIIITKGGNIINAEDRRGGPLVGRSSRRGPQKKTEDLGLGLHMKPGT